MINPRIKKKLLLPLIITTLSVSTTALCSLPTKNLTSTGFTIKHKPINPGCLKMINGSLADLPFIYQINLNRCQHANATYREDENSRVFRSADGQTYTYQVIGQTQNGIFVVATQMFTGGSGQFQDILLLRLKKKYTYTYNNQQHRFNKTPYTALVYLGSIGGGDRYTGSYATLKIIKNTLVGQRYSDQNQPIQRTHPNQKITINLSNI